jgi:DNA-binding response OmpR family regulator
MPKEPGKSTILIVDDDKLAVQMLDILLTGQGYWTRHAYSGQEALDLVEREALQATGWRPWGIDLVLLDVMMPGVDGFKVCLRIKDDPALRHIPVIMVSVLSAARDKITAVSFGADGYITKPYRSEELLSTVQASLRTKAQQEALLRRGVELQTINATAASAHRSLNPSIVMASALTALLKCQHIEAAAIYTVDEATKSLTLAQAQGPEGVDLPTVSSCPLGEGIIGGIAGSKQGQWFVDITSRPDCSDRSSSPMSACVGVPLCADDRAVGVLEVFHRQPGWFDERDVVWLDELGYRVGRAIGNANLFERAQNMLIQ